MERRGCAASAVEYRDKRCVSGCVAQKKTCLSSVSVYLFFPDLSMQCRCVEPLESMPSLTFVDTSRFRGRTRSCPRHRFLLASVLGPSAAQ